MRRAHPAPSRATQCSPARQQEYDIMTDMRESQTQHPTQDAPPDGGARAQLIAALQQNWRRENEGARTYRDLATREKDPNKRAVLLRLAEAEERHALKWEHKLAQLGVAPPSYNITWRDRLRDFVRRGIGTDAALRQMEAADDVDIARYEAHAQAVSDEEARRMLREVPPEEDSHGLIIPAMVPPPAP